MINVLNADNYDELVKVTPLREFLKDLETGKYQKENKIHYVFIEGDDFLQLGNLRFEHPLHPFYADNYINDISHEHIYMFKNFFLTWFQDEEEYKIFYNDEVVNYRIIQDQDEESIFYVNVDLDNGAIMSFNLANNELENFRIKLEQITLVNKLKRNSHDNINELNPMTIEYNKLQKKLTYLVDFVKEKQLENEDSLKIRDELIKDFLTREY